MSDMHHYAMAGTESLRRAVAAALVTIAASVAFAMFIFSWFLLALIVGRFL